MTYLNNTAFLKKTYHTPARTHAAAAEKIGPLSRAEWRRAVAEMLG
ncbi:hypothetical protein [Sphingomonas sp. ID0503]